MSLPILDQSDSVSIEVNFSLLCVVVGIGLLWNVECNMYSLFITVQVLY